MYRSQIFIYKPPFSHHLCANNAKRLLPSITFRIPLTRRKPFFALLCSLKIPLPTLSRPVFSLYTNHISSLALLPRPVT